MIRIAGPPSPYDPTYHLLLRFDKIAAIVARENPDILEIHSPYLAALGAFRARPSSFGVRTFQWHSDFIDTYVGVLASRLPDRSRRAHAARVATRPLWGLVRSIARRCEATLVASQWQRDKLASHDVPRVVHVPFGIERSVFHPNARSYEARRKLLALAGRDTRDDDTAVIVGLGRFAIEKRWDVVIDAFLRFRRTRNAVLVLFGDGPERDRMRARSAGSPDVAFAGFAKDRNELAGALASADVLLHGCPFETFGLSIAEAMSAGLPVVVPDEGGAAEILTSDAGAKYRAGDADDAARALGAVLDRVRTGGNALREKAAATTSQYPTVREQFEGQLRLYADLLKNVADRPSS